MATAKSTSGKGRKQKSPAADATSLIPSGTISVSPVMVRVDLWAGQDSAEVPAIPLAMVKDFLAASGYEIEEIGSASVSATLQSPLQAVRVVRQIQQLIFGYCSAVPTTSFGICTTLSNADEPVPVVDFHLLDQTRSAARTASGQTLLVGRLCDSVRSIPGLRFEALSGGIVSRDEQGGARTVLLLLPLADEEGHEWKPLAMTAPQPPQYKSAGGIAQSPARAIVAGDAEDRLATSKPDTMNTPGTTSTTTVQAKFTPGAWNRSPLLWIGIGAAVIVLLIAVGTSVGRSRKNPTNQAVASTASPPSTPTASDVVTPAVPGDNSQSAKTVPAVPGSSSQPPLKPTAKEHTPKAKEGSERIARTSPAPNEDPPAHHSDPQISLNPSEVNFLIDRADKLSGDGKFDQAIVAYEFILKQEPSNVRAKEGLARAIRNKKSQ